MANTTPANMYDRNSYIDFTAANGNDPLSDKLINKVRLLPIAEKYLIQIQNQFRSDKIAAKFYADSSLYWIILEYNKLMSNSELTAGKTISITTNKVITTKTIFIK
jgi:hypothetical protein